MKKYRKIIAAIGFSMALMLSATVNQPLLVAAAASGETKEEQTADTESAESQTEKIEIKDVQGFQELLKNCQYDSWSVGKTVRLVANIDISSLDFTGIAYFSGTFEGDGPCDQPCECERDRIGLRFFPLSWEKCGCQ